MSGGHVGLRERLSQRKKTEPGPTHTWLYSVCVCAECDCEHGVCNKGPDGDGQCLCQPPYTGRRCDQGEAWTEPGSDKADLSDHQRYENHSENTDGR